MGLKQIKDSIQVKSMDNDLRVGIWNYFTEHLWNIDNQKKFRFTKELWCDFFKRPFDEMPIKQDLYRYPNFNDVYSTIRNYFFKAPWNEVYDFIEYCTCFIDNSSNYYSNQLNLLLEKELSGYRFIDERIVPITDEREIESIRLAASSKYSNVDEHIRTAVELFSDKKNPDYRNSIKESISAVEAMCNIVAGEKNATLGKALDKIEKQRKVEMHTCLKSAFDKLYGYTSDSKTGIRHMMMDESVINFEDAKYMLVSCSAFINYLKEKLSKIK